MLEAGYLFKVVSYERDGENYQVNYVDGVDSVQAEFYAALLPYLKSNSAGTTNIGNMPYGAKHLRKYCNAIFEEMLLRGIKYCWQVNSRFPSTLNREEHIVDVLVAAAENLVGMYDDNSAIRALEGVHAYYLPEAFVPKKLGLIGQVVLQEE